ncbi:MAG: GNAT family N-acetyltransferase [Nitrososphaerota archaeon]|nr:GNAT family N-acetyltransferase [Nitrososphaerota archaeon]
MDFQIEPANIGFLDALYLIEKQCFDVDAFTKRQIAYLLSDYSAIALVAKAGPVIAGFIIAQMETDSVDFGHIITLNVAQVYRGKKVATRMLEAIEVLIKLRGADECRLEVREDNYAAINLYTSLRYQCICQLKGYYGSGHGLYFKKSL